MRVTRNRRAVGADPEALSGGAYSDDRPGRKPIPACKVLDAVLWILNTAALSAHASSVLPELQDGTPALSAVVRQRSDSRGAHGVGERAS